MQHQTPRGRLVSVFVKEDALPGAQRRPTFDEWNGQMRLRQRCPDVCRHVVRPLDRVFEQRVAIWYQPREEAFKEA